jgi:hypothetical protein
MLVAVSCVTAVVRARPLMFDAPVVNAAAVSAAWRYQSMSGSSWLVALAW